MASLRNSGRTTTSGQCLIPLFAKLRAHSSIPLVDDAAVAHRAGQERPQAGACALLLTVASTAAGLRSKRMFIVSQSRGTTPLLALVIGTTMTVVAASAAFGQARVDRTTATLQALDPFADHIAEAARRFAIPATWIRSVMRAESNGNPRALSAKGAIGLMQIMPPTWQDLRARHNLGTDPYDPRDNILAGAAYLRGLHDRFGLPGFLAAYNAGPERYTRHLATGQPLPDETQNYVAMLLPLLNGGPANDGIFAAAPRTWQQSPIFTARAESSATDDTSPPAVQQNRRPSVRAIVDTSTLTPQSGDLFARRADLRSSQ
jgi:hypothetical protein